MTLKKKQLTASFQFESRILYDILGSEIIESDSIAIAEQIKNAKDASAKKIIIDFSKITNDIIVIQDNGKGMSEDTIKKEWFMIGTKNKASDNSDLGGKGIGRLSLFRLADNIKVETIKNNIKHTFTLDRELIETSGLNNISISQQAAENEKSGTTLTLTRLKDYINLAEIEKDLENLVHPNEPIIHSLIFPDSYARKNYNLSEEILSKAPFYAETIVEGNNIISYKFKCSVKNTVLYENSEVNQKLFKSLETKLINNFASNINLGKVHLKLHNFYFDKKYIPWHGEIDVSKIKNELLKVYLSTQKSPKC